VPEHLADPLRWTKPRRVFVNSMSDLFHEGLANEEIAAVFGVMAASPRHTFQVLTKRAKRMREWFEWASTLRASDGVLGPRTAFGCAVTTGLVLRAARLEDVMSNHAVALLDVSWPLRNVWIGVSAEDQERADDRVPELLRTPAAVRFVSYEPALGPLELERWMRRNSDALGYLGSALDWVIVGGESGPHARPFDIAWARSAVLQCKTAGVAVFCKQLGSNAHHFPLGPLKLKSRKGDDPREWPKDLRVREWPRGAS
jgi:protein gp37